MVVGSPIVLNLVPGGVMKMVHVNQADKNIDIQFQIMNGNQPYNIPEGWTGTIRGTKGDAFGYSAAVTVTAGSNVVTVHLKEQLTAVAGVGNIFELVFASTSAKVSTENFILAVERSALNDETVISESDLVYANQVLNQLQSVAAVNQQVQQNKANIATETATRAAADTTLQNNINAEAAARQAADNTLQSNINAEASTRATADASLQSQIDQLVAPSGEAPSAAEVLNARIGADGVTYQTLGDAIRTNDSELKSQLETIEVDDYDRSNYGEVVDISGYKVNQKLVAVDTANNTFSILSNNAYHYYDIPVGNLGKITARGYSGLNVKAVVFTNASNALIDYYPKETIPTPGQMVEVICDVPSNATRILIVSFTDQIAKLGTYAIHFSMGAELINTVNTANAFANLSIENYERAKEDLGTLYENAYYNDSGQAVSIDGFCYKSYVGVVEGETYYLSGVGGTGNRFYVVQDADGNVIDVYPSTNPPQSFEDYEYTVPHGAVKITVNGRSFLMPAILKDSINTFVLKNYAAPMATDTGNNTFTVGKGDFKHTVDLYGSANGTFNYSTLKYDSNTFKNVSDDITPVNLTNVGYVGANHGYMWVYSCVASAHGLTASDIGKTYNDGTRTWVLIQITDANTFVVGCYNSEVWQKLNRGVAPTTLNFGTALSVTATLAQLYPSVKNIDVKVIENTAKRFAVLETYDIIDVGTGIDAIIAHIGGNTNDSVAMRADSLLTVRNIYEFHDNGSVTVYQNLKALKSIRMDYYGGIQSMAFSTNDGYAVPKTSLKAITQTNGTTVSFDRTTWDDPTEPPMLYVQTNNSANNMTSAMLLGYLSEDRNSNIYSTAGRSEGASRKMYPYMVYTYTMNIDVGTVYNSASFRIPVAGITAADKLFYGYTLVNDDVYMFIASRQAVNTSIKVPDEAYGKRVTVIMSDGMECGTQVTTDSIDVVSSGIGYIAVKIS